MIKCPECGGRLSCTGGENIREMYKRRYHCRSCEVMVLTIEKVLETKRKKGAAKNDNDK